MPRPHRPRCFAKRRFVSSESFRFDEQVVTFEPQLRASAPKSCPLPMMESDFFSFAAWIRNSGRPVLPRKQPVAEVWEPAQDQILGPIDNFIGVCAGDRAWILLNRSIC